MSRMKADFLHTLNHYRHDILNELQLVKGYLSLNKIEKAQKCIDHIVIRANEDTQVCQIGAPNLVYFLLNQRMTQQKMRVDIDLDVLKQHMLIMTRMGDDILSIIQGIIGSLEKICQEQMENDLLIVFEGSGEQLCLVLEFDGFCHEEANMHSLDAALKQIHPEKMKRFEKSLEENKLHMNMTVII